MPYIGVSPFNGVRKKHTYTATASQTSFSGAGTEGSTLTYKDSTFVDVFQNGVKLGEADYTSTSGTAIVLAQGASVNDLIEVVVYDVFSVADTVSKADGGTFDGNVNVNGTVEINSTTTSDFLVVKTTEAGSGSAPDVVFARDSSSPADNDFLGKVVFRGKNDASEDVEYAQIISQLIDASDGTEDGKLYLQTKVNGSDTNVAVIDSSGLTVTGNLVISTSGKGIDFSATADNTAQSSSMASELLDDYEEGSWTPTYSITSGVGDLSFSGQGGQYIKIGNMVTIWFYMAAGESSASGTVRVNVPFTSFNASNYFAVASLTKTGWASVTGDIEGRISANASIINLNIVNNANESGGVTNGNTDASFILYGTLTYKVA